MVSGMSIPFEEGSAAFRFGARRLGSLGSSSSSASSLFSLAAFAFPLARVGDVGGGNSSSVSGSWYAFRGLRALAERLTAMTVSSFECEGEFNAGPSAGE